LLWILLPAETITFILKRFGNRVDRIYRWKDRDTDAALGRFLEKLHAWGYKPGVGMMVIGDATGVGKPQCDGLRARGIAARDFNFGGATKDQAYKNEGARVWHYVAKLPPSRRSI